ncbi:hypothetical protein CBR_g24394 [Chara braunii]|uniref:Integrase catalytic domain-containing protein n=1 Tax=Chara braunii TaxID=69332 RepID=A0A388JMM9_CHABU|nr:hypothetical protein CBR_g24394 [Chara braunii]|eukprot:GBG59048.1 hypothetical protein CBR_g24394 [Chara braunii]
MSAVPRQPQCHVSSATSAVPRQQQCHISSATSAVPHQQCPATMTGSTLGMPGQLANESIADYKQRFQTQLALIEAEEQRQVAAEAVRLQAEAAATAEKQRLQAEADADTQARRKEAQDLLQRHEATSIEKLKFWHFEPSEEHDDATPEEQHKEFMAKLVTRLVYTCNHLQSELANLQRAVRNHKAQHEDAARALDSCVQDLEQTAPRPEAGESSSAPSARQLEERVDHVVAMLGDISTFAAPATISSQLDTLKTELTRLWKKRFIVDDASALAINRLFAMTQGNTTTRDWLMEWQKIAATPDLELPFSHLRREFYNRSCAALSLALGDREQYATFAEIIDKAKEIIKTNRAAAHEKSAWQPTYVEKVPTPLMDAGVEVVDLHAYIAKIDREFKTQRRSLDEHVEHLRTVLERLRQAKYKANRDKCEFARQELEYLGHYVMPQGIRPLADKIEALRVWPEPTNTTDVRSFMGLAGYYQRFITGYSRIVAPMTRLQSPKAPFVFDDDACRSFQALKTAMVMARVLSIYDPTLPTKVTTHASGYGIGAVLEQHDGDDWHPVEYFSHKVPPINSLDDARKKELLAFVMALKRWRHFLLGSRTFTWVRENNPLTYYKTQFDEELQRHFIRGYESNPDSATLYAQLSSDHPPAIHYRIVDWYLLLHSRGKDLLCVPRDRRLRTCLLGEYHDSRLAGHFEVNRTIARLRQRFRWPDLITDVTRYCDSCEVCRRSKPRNRNPYSELRPMPIPWEPGLSIAMDVTGPFPRDCLGHDGILTVVDRLSKYARFLPCKYYSTAPELARLLHTGWICGHGVPEDMVSDRDIRFMSAFWTALMQESDMKMKPSSARHP